MIDYGYGLVTVPELPDEVVFPLAVTMRDPVNPASPTTRPATIGDISENVKRTWRQSSRGRGGYWLASAEFDGEDWEKEQLFVDGLRRDIFVEAGGAQVWNGLIARMELTRPNGDTFIRDWTQVANRKKAIFTKIGDNQFTNGSAESSAWSDYNSPVTNEQSTTWVADGSYSNHIVTNSANDGAIIQTGIAIVANKAYQCSVMCNLISGDWFLEIYRTDTGEMLAQRGEDSAGEVVLACSISADNEYTGNIGVRLYTDDSGAAEIYADGAIFQAAPVRAETAWYEDTASQDVFGVIEDAILLGGSSAAAAIARAKTELREQAWARSLPPERYGTGRPSEQARLVITFCGYSWTLNSKYCETVGSDEMGNHVTALVGDAQFVTARKIDSNTTSYQIDDQAPIRVWDALEEIAINGDSSGDRWEIGVYQDRRLSYGEVTESYTYTWRDGVLLDRGGALEEPWLVRPKYVLIDDMPLGPEQISGYETDNPRVVYMFEVTFDARDWWAGKYGLRWLRDPER